MKDVVLVAMSTLSFDAIIGKKVLIIGDVGTGKTAVMAGLLRQALSLGLSNKISIIDFAPPRQRVKDLWIGGRLKELIEVPNDVKYFAPGQVEAPRCHASNAQELVRLAKLNAQRMTPIIYDYLRDPTPIVFINDVSLLFHAGELDPVLRVLRNCETAIINGYYGEALREDLGTDVSKRERELIEKLAEVVDIVLRTPL